MENAAQAVRDLNSALNIKIKVYQVNSYRKVDSPCLNQAHTGISDLCE